MTQEPDQLPAPDAGSTLPAGSTGTGSKQGTRPRAGVPVWRIGKPDAFLAAAVDVARTAVESIAPAEQIGEHIGARSEGDRLVTHLFESRLPGYLGWQWYAVLTRNSRSKVVTVDELGLLPSDDSILAPAWIPWAERVRPEDAQADDAADEAPGSETPSQASDAGTQNAAETDASESDAAESGAAESGAAESDADESDAAERERSADEAD
ncbi:DUF3027 domain-containing protein [Arthrobacter sp. ok362]|uniref:DUF3027 domain-containing protein n=1 Tax=Arthrobacter sp. ok362 TaxID=1761745 RepID=UPI00088927FE|nr:DUF3027 domain-containing protein [Arthrobacter sp. ok362]SDL70727.1 Protein of unknown function [Arthrobacter sp. ok362]